MLYGVSNEVCLFMIGRLLKGVPSATPLYTFHKERTLNKVNKQKKIVRVLYFVSINVTVSMGKCGSLRTLGGSFPVLTLSSLESHK